MRSSARHFGRPHSVFSASTRNQDALPLTFVLRRELPHLRRQALVELVLAGDERLADGLLAEAQHARVAAHLVHEGLKHDPFAAGVRSPVRLHEGFQRGTHPHSASGG